MTYVEINADWAEDGTTEQEMGKIAGQYRGHPSDRKATTQAGKVWQFDNPQDARQFTALMTMGGAVNGFKITTKD